MREGSCFTVFVFGWRELKFGPGIGRFVTYLRFGMGGGDRLDALEGERGRSCYESSWACRPHFFQTY
jgi:hypothetical protein